MPETEEQTPAPPPPPPGSSFTPEEEAINQDRLHGDHEELFSMTGPTKVDPGPVKVAGIMTDPENQARVTGYIWIAAEPPAGAQRGSVVSWLSPEEEGSKADLNLKEFASNLARGSVHADFTADDFYDYWYDHQGSGYHEAHGTRFTGDPIDLGSYTEDVLGPIKEQADQYGLEMP